MKISEKRLVVKCGGSVQINNTESAKALIQMDQSFPVGQKVLILDRFVILLEGSNLPQNFNINRNCEVQKHITDILKMYKDVDIEDIQDINPMTDIKAGGWNTLSYAVVDNVCITNMIYPVEIIIFVEL